MAQIFRRDYKPKALVVRIILINFARHVFHVSPITSTRNNTGAARATEPSRHRHRRRRVAVISDCLLITEPYLSNTMCLIPYINSNVILHLSTTIFPGMPIPPKAIARFTPKIILGYRVWGYRGLGSNGVVAHITYMMLTRSIMNAPSV